MTCNIENECNPLPEYCRRLAMPIVGRLGWFVYLVELIPLSWVSLMLVGVAEQNHIVIVGLLAGSILVSLLAWIINYMNNAPCFSNVTIPTTCNPCGCELIIKNAPCDFAIRVREGLRHSGDQEHFQVSLAGGLFAFIVFGAFIIQYGTDAFNYVDPAFATQQNGYAQVMFFAIAKIIQGMIVLVYVNSFRLLTVTSADSIYRYVTAINESPEKSKNVNDSLSYGSKVSTADTKVRKNAGTIAW